MDILNELTDSIGKRESSGRYDALGRPTKKGNRAYGKYQVMDFNVPNWTKEALGKSMTPDEFLANPQAQDTVAKHKLGQYLQQYGNPEDAASVWFSGQPRAKSGNAADVLGTTTNEYVNDVSNLMKAPTGNLMSANIGGGTLAQKIKAKYPQYADIPDAELEQKIIAKYPQYADMASGGAQNGSVPTGTDVTNAPKKDNFFVSLAKGIVEPVATLAARPLQAGAELLGASEEQVNKATKDLAGDWVAPVPHTFGDVGKDVGRGLEAVSLGMPVGTIGKAATLGAVAGVGSGLEQGGSATDVLKQGALGAGFGAAGGLLAKGLEKLPQWLAGDAFKGLSPDEVQHALQTKSIGTSKGILEQSKKAIEGYGQQIADILDASPSAGGGDFAVRATLEQFPEYTGKEATMLAKIKRLLPAGYDAGLISKKIPRSSILKFIDKIQEGTATLAEKNAVRSAIDSATAGGWAKAARSLNPSAGHDLAMSFAGALRNEVQQSAPETIPIFEEFAKEMAFNKVIQKLANSKSGGLLRWSDIVPFMLGNVAGPLGGVGVVAAHRIASSPATEFGIAKGVEGVQKVLNPVLGRAGLASTIK